MNDVTDLTSYRRNIKLLETVTKTNELLKTIEHCLSKLEKFKQYRLISYCLTELNTSRTRLLEYKQKVSNEMAKPKVDA